MRFHDILKISVSNIVRNKLRTLLTVVGISIGILSVIVISAIGSGGQASINGELDKLGMDGVNIKPSLSKPGSRISLEDADAIKENVRGIKAITPVYFTYGTVQAGDAPKKVVLNGMNVGFDSIFKLKLAYGRNFRGSDLDERRRMCMISESLAKKVFGRADATGQPLKLTILQETYTFLVSGVFKSGTSTLDALYEQQAPSYIYVPMTTLQSILGAKHVDYISLTATDERELEHVGKAAVNFLSKKSNMQSEYYAENMAMQRDRLKNIVGTVTLIVSAIGAISLVVGGVGVMNIMLVSVSERTREIGIRKAIGATQGNILHQFLNESIVITMLSSVVGVVFGCATAYFLLVFMQLPFALPVETIGWVVAVSFVVGAVFGAYPAKKAAQLNPIDALR